MAEKAQAEPTMEEILASIRKIIADDGERVQGAGETQKKPSEVSVNVSDDDDYEDLSLDDVLESAGDSDEPPALATDDEVLSNTHQEDDHLANVDSDIFSDLAAGDDEPAELETSAEDDDFDSLESFDLDPVDFEDDPELTADATDSVEESFDTSSDEWETGATLGSFDLEPDSEPEQPTAMESPAMETTGLRGKTESAKTSAEGLTDERIAGAAASALGKLMVKQSEEAGQANPNTLEDLMMELLRPMIKEWLDANLPAIVERKVEEEVQRIARMAR